MSDPIQPVNVEPTRRVDALADVRQALREPAAEAAAHPVGSGVTLRRLWQFKWTGLLVAVVLGSVAAPMVWLAVEPQFEAAAVVEIQSKTPYFVTQDERGQGALNYSQFVSTQAAIMRSAPVLQRTLERADVKETAWYKTKVAKSKTVTANNAGILESLADAVLVAPRKGTELVDISALARSAEDAAVLANAVLEEYLQFNTERFSKTDQMLFEGLSAEQRKLEADIAFSENELAETRKGLLMIKPDELIDQRRLRLDGLDEKIMQTDLDIALAESRLKTHENDKPTELSDVEKMQRYSGDLEWVRLRMAVLDAQRRVDELENGSLSPEHPTVVARHHALTTAQSRLTDRENVLAASGGAAMVTAGGVRDPNSDPAALRQQLEALQSHRGRLQNLKRDLRTEIEGDFQAAESVRRESDALERNRERLTAVKKRIEQLADKTRVPPTVGTISKAAPPTRPNEDKRIKFCAGALMAALLAGVGAAYLRAMLAPQVHEAREIGEEVGGAFLGFLPLEARKPLDEVPTSLEYTESVRMTRTALLRRLGGAGGHVVQISSSTPGSGKSTLAVSLARSMADCGKRVLLVDGDFHRPTLQKYFGLKTAPGLANLISGAVGEESVIRSTAQAGLSILPAGEFKSREDHERIANGAFQALVEKWRRRYDVVLLDSPPLLASADAAIMSGHADGVVMVVRERHCRRDGLIKSITTLSLAGGRLIGTVFLGSLAHQGYGYGYGYGQPAATGDRRLILDVHEANN